MSRSADTSAAVKCNAMQCVASGATATATATARLSRFNSDSGSGSGSGSGSASRSTSSRVGWWPPPRLLTVDFIASRHSIAPPSLPPKSRHKDGVDMVIDINWLLSWQSTPLGELLTALKKYRTSSSSSSSSAPPSASRAIWG
jgi:hypothetical protein